MGYGLTYSGYSGTTTSTSGDQYRLRYSDYYPGVGAGPPGTISFADISGRATFAQLPPSVQKVPITFVLSGKPATGAIANAPVVMAMTVPSGLVGTMVFDSIRATSNTTFTLNRIVGGTTVTAIGAVTITPSTNTSVTLTGTGGTLNAGDVLQLIAPVQDATLSDIGITLLCSRI